MWVCNAVVKAINPKKHINQNAVYSAIHRQNQPTLFIKYSGEHTYRSDLQVLLESLIPENINVISEPTKIKCGKPDYMLFKDDIELGSIETKDIGKDLNSKEYAEQFERYKQGFQNLI